MAVQSPEFMRPYFNAAAGGSARIIPFPGLAKPIGRTGFPLRAKQNPASAPILATPGRSLPSGIPDFRPDLQRDGIILLAWDKRKTEMGERYTAYWVTSTGISRYYASKLLSMDDFSSARPDHKSYAAEDGIEFYGQEAPVYVAHVAPELMKSNPRHVELRQIHINALKHQGSKVDFKYKYLLKTDKNRGLPSKKPEGCSHHKAM
jgi:hypothetical protein